MNINLVCVNASQEPLKIRYVCIVACGNVEPPEEITESKYTQP